MAINYSHLIKINRQFNSANYVFIYRQRANLASNKHKLEKPCIINHILTLWNS